MTKILDTHCYREHVIARLLDLYGSADKTEEARTIAIFEYGVDFGYRLAEQDRQQPSQIEECHSA